MAKMDPLVSPVYLVNPSKARRVTLESRERLETKVPKDLLEMTELPSRASPALMDSVASMDSLASRENREMLDHKDLQVLLVSTILISSTW